MKHTKSCKTCINGLTNSLNKDILCRINGIVSQDFICSKFRPIPKFKSLITRRNKCIDCEFYIVDGVKPADSMTIGYCQLFTVRTFNGEIKNACSKFVLKHESIVS